MAETDGKLYPIELYVSERTEQNLVPKDIRRRQISLGIPPNGWSTKFTFNAYAWTDHCPQGMMRIVVATSGQVNNLRDPLRYKISRESALEGSGWTDLFSFCAYNPDEVKKPEEKKLIEMKVYQTGGGQLHEDPHRFYIDEKPPQYDTWVLAFTFYAFHGLTHIPLMISETGVGNTPGNPLRGQISNRAVNLASWEPKFTFYVVSSDAEMPSLASENPFLKVYKVTSAGFYGNEDNPLKYDLSFVEDSRSSCWKEVFRFHAYTQPVAGGGSQAVHVYYRGQKNDPDRCLFSLDANVPYGWTKGITFYAFPASNVGRLTLYVSQTGEEGKAGNPLREQISTEPASCAWVQKFALQVFSGPFPGLEKIYVSSAGEIGEPRDPLRYKISHERHGSGWSDVFSFYAHSTQTPGTQCVLVAQRLGANPETDPHRFLVTPFKKDPLPKDWNEAFEFYAHIGSLQNRIPLYVSWTGNASDSHQLSYQMPSNTTTIFSFQAYSEQFYGMKKIIVSSKDKHYRIELESGSQSGWNEEISFYAFPDTEMIPGAKKFCVFSTGNDNDQKDRLRYMITHTDGAVVKGWIQAFTFFAYPYCPKDDCSTSETLRIKSLEQQVTALRKEVVTLRGYHRKSEESMLERLAMSGYPPTGPDIEYDHISTGHSEFGEEDT